MTLVGLGAEIDENRLGLLQELLREATDELGRILSGPGSPAPSSPSAAAPTASAPPSIDAARAASESPTAGDHRPGGRHVTDPTESATATPSPSSP